jgi:fucose permease
MKKENIIPKIVSVMLAFFTMGFVDLVGIATNYVKSDFDLTDTMANSFSIMVFVWFLIFSIPTSILMNKIGRKKTVLLSLIVTFLGLLIPYVEYSKTSMIVYFSFIGIGNTLMQVSLNPLLTNIVNAQKLPSFLTLGQFVKAIASFMAPIIAGQALLRYGDWKLLFPVFSAVALIAIIYLALTGIKEHSTDVKTSTFKECICLLGNKVILFLFLGILVHVGIDVGINITAPKLLIERAGMTLTDAGYATSFYFLFRTIGCFSGTFILALFPARKFFAVSVLAILLGVVGLYFSYTSVMVYICVALIGIGNSNIFPIIFSRALMYMPARSNEISGLMIMGISGGAVFPTLMGLASDSLNGQIGAVIILTVCVAYLFLLMTKLKGIENKQA